MSDETARTKRPYKIDGDVARARASLGGTTRAARQTPEERQALARAGGLASAAKKRAAREAAGAATVKPPAPPSPPIGADALDYWRKLVLAEQPDRVWSSSQELKRAAISRARQDVARASLEAAKNRGAE